MFEFKAATKHINAGKRTYVLLLPPREIMGCAGPSIRAMETLSAKGATYHKVADGEKEQRLHKLHIDDEAVMDDLFCEKYAVTAVPQLLVFCGDKDEEGVTIPSGRCYPEGSELECEKAYLKAITETRKSNGVTISY